MKFYTGFLGLRILVYMTALVSISKTIDCGIFGVSLKEEVESAMETEPEMMPKNLLYFYACLFLKTCC